MQKSTTRVLTLFLSLILLLPLCLGCGETAQNSQTTPQAVVTEDPDPNGYKYPNENYGDETFTIMGCEEKYKMITNVLSDEMNGVEVNDSQYAMKMFLEDKFHVQLVEERIGYYSETDTLTPIVASGDPKYDIVYLQIGNVGTMFASDYLVNLCEMPGLQADGAWWNQQIREESTILGDRLYFLVGDANLMAFDGTWVNYFNKAMFEDRGIPFPYQTVKDGKWTLDELYRICHTYAEPNGDARLTSFSPTGTAIYGFATQVNCMSAFLTGCNEVYCKLDADKRPYFALAESTTLADAADKIARLVSATGDGTFINTNTEEEHYIRNVFMQERTLMAGGEVADARNMVEMKHEYGILPMPKANEDQESYKSHMLTEALYLAVPTSCGDLERAAVLMDSMAYYASKNTLPKYYNSVCYKGLNDPESVEMLEIIHKTQYLNWGMAYGWLDGAVSTVVNVLNNGQTGLVSKVQGQKRGVDALIARTMKAFED